MPDSAPEVFRVRSRLESFSHAVRGLRWMLSTQHNARIHAAATAVVCIAALSFGVSRGEWLALVLAVAAVWTAEAFNSALEELGDAVSLEVDPRIGRAKDAAAGAVLVAAVASVVVGLLVFGPRLLLWIAALD